MNKDFSIRTVWIAAAVSVAAAVLLGIRTAASLREKTGRLNEYCKLAGKLDDLERKTERRTASIKAYEELKDPHPMPMAQLLVNALPEEKYETRELQSAPTIPGWTLRRVEVSFQSMELRKMAVLLAAAGNCRPPWRFAELAITALGDNGSSGQVRLVAEALDKTQ